MDFLQLQEKMKKNFPDSNVKYDFDSNCERVLNICITDSQPHLYHFVEFNKVKVTVEGKGFEYVPIDCHRVTVTWSFMQEVLNSKTGVYIAPSDIQEIRALKDTNSELYENSIKQLVELCGLDREEIESKIRS